MIKKALALAILLPVTFLIKAQEIPNSGFENWNYYHGANYEVPVGWTTNDVLTSKINNKYKGSCTSKTSEAHSGNYAIKMQVVIDHGDTANGCIYSVNNIDSVILLDEGKANAGFKYFLHATSLNGYYKFTSTSSDSAFFGVTLSKWNTATHKRDILVNTIFLIGQNCPNYLPFVVPFKYRITQENPDTALVVIGIQGAHGQPAHQGTTLFIDDIGFAAKTPAKKD